MNIAEKLCTICKHRNERNAVLCQRCGAVLDQFVVAAIATRRNEEWQTDDAETIEGWLLDRSIIPVNSIAVYIAGTTKPVFVCSDDEFTIGRRGEPGSEPFFDLSNLGGYLLGISRRHARIRRAGQSYEIMDLGSTNGTWLSEQRLIPHQTYSLTSGSQLRLGRLRFIILFRAMA